LMVTGYFPFAGLVALIAVAGVLGYYVLRKRVRR